MKDYPIIELSSFLIYNAVYSPLKAYSCFILYMKVQAFLEKCFLCTLRPAKKKNSSSNEQLKLKIRE